MTWPWRWFRRGNDGLTDRQRARMTALFYQTIGSRQYTRKDCRWVDGVCQACGDTETAW